MKKKLAMLLALLCLATVGNPLFVRRAEAGSIHIYTQSNYNYTSSNGYNLSVTYKGSSSNLATIGCCTFTFAHAIQWLENTAYSTDDQRLSLLATLVSKCSKPAEQGMSKYTSYMNSLGYSNVSPTYTETWASSFFGQGGAMVAHLYWKENGGGGHYLLACGYTKKNGTAYILVTDSNSQSTVRRVKSYDSSFNVTTSLTGGKQYWIPLSAFSAGYVSYNGWTAMIKLEKGWLPLVKTIPTSLQMNKTVASLNLSDTLSLSVTAYPANASNSVTWSSSDTSIATVSSSGVVTALKANQTVTITATSTADTSKTASCQVTTYYQGTDTLKFSSVKYPHTYNKNKDVTWEGKVESDVALTSIVINLYQGTNKYTQSANITSGSKSYTMSDLGSSTFKKLSAGTFTFEVIATDSVGRRIAYSNDSCSVTTSGNNTQYDVPGSYARPKLLGSGERNGHRYEVYENSGRNWDADKDYAIELGGHLATISDAEENDFICNLVVSSGGTYGFVGGYYSGGWRWVDGTPFNYSVWNSNAPADGSMAYSAVVGLASAKTKSWSKSLKTNMMNFVVEYDPIPVSSIVIEGNNTMTYGDGTQTLSWTVLPEGAYNKSVKFSSSNTSYATVNEDTGVVSIVKDADADVVIYATAQDGSDVVGTFELFVQHKPVPVTGVSIQTDSSLYIGDEYIQLMVGQTATFTETVTPSNADNPSVYYFSGDDTIASFEPYSSTVTAISPGITAVWCYTSDGKYNDAITVEVLPVSGSCGTNATWSYANGVLTISGTGAMTVYASDTEQPWYGYRTSITKVIVNEGVTTVGSHAFEGCTALKEISIPSTLRGVGASTFRLCSSLLHITLPDQVNTIGSKAFEACTKLQDFVLPSSTKTVSSSQFWGCSSITEYVIPDGVTSIGGTAFKKNTSLTKIVIPASVTTIADTAFVDDENLTIYCYGSSTAHTFAQNNNIPFVLIGGPCGDNLNWRINGTILTISGSGAMYDYERGTQPWLSQIGSITEINMTGGTTVGNYAFDNDQLKTYYTKVTLPNTLTKIGTFAFYNNQSMKSITIPSSVRTIYSNAFRLCKGLESVQWYKGITQIAQSVFYSCTNLKSIDIPEGVTWIDQSAFEYCPQLTTVTLPSTLVGIKAYAFKNCTSLSSITLPDSLKGIGSSVFENCKNLTNLYVSKNVTAIGETSPFTGCTNLTITCWDDSTVHTHAVANSIPHILLDTPINNPDFVIPNAVQTIDIEAFSGIAAKRVKLPDGVTKISSLAFAYCPNLVGIYIPEDCTSIAATAFSGVTGLTIYGEDGSYAEFYANKYGFGFEAVN